MSNGNTRRRGSAAFIALVLGLVAGAAPAASHADTRTVSSGTGSSGLDIAWAKHHHARRADRSFRLRHTVSMHEKWRSRRLRCGNDITIHIKDTNRTIRISWKDGLRARIYDSDRKNNDPIRYSRAVWRTDRRTVTLSIKRRHLGKIGDDYRWRVTTTWSGACGCDDTPDAACAAFLDEAPAKGYIRHML